MSRKDLSGNKDVLKLISSDDILGKDVIDLEGSQIGIVDVVHIDPINLEFAGVSVDGGFMKNGITIGKKYIDKITSHALFLNIRPAFALRGMLVFDINGALVGKVKDVELLQRQNVIKQLVVSQGFFNKRRISGELVNSVGHNIFLSVTLDDLKKVTDKSEEKNEETK